VLTRQRLLLLLPFLITAVALGLRLTALQWDGGNFYHPDERSIYLRVDCMYRVLTDDPGWPSCVNRDFPEPMPGIPSLGTFFDADRSPLNPRWFPLGSILLYVLVLIRWAMDWFMDQVRLQDLASAGRAFSAFADTASVLLLFALGKRVFNHAVGLIAAALFAFSPAFIQLAHFYRPESFSVLLALVAFWRMLDLLDKGRLRDHAWLGIAVGANFAVKATSIPLLAPVALTYVILLYRQRRAAETGSVAGPVVSRAVVMGVVALAAFAVLQPYALIDWTKFAADLTWEAGIAREAGRVPYTMQYIGVDKGTYELRQSAVWALGLPLGIVAWLGLALSSVRAWSRARTGEALLVAWVLVFLASIVTFDVKFLRYVAPVLPVMSLLGARWLWSAHQWARGRRVLLTRATAGVMAFVLFATAFFGLAFVNAYGKPHPGMQASTWVNDNVPAGTPIVTDNHWDEGFANLGRYPVSQIPMFDGDSVAKLRAVSERVAGAGYILQYSNRTWGVISRIPHRYPQSSAFYELLFAGELGFQLEQAFARYPSLLGVTFTHDPFTRAGLARPETLPGIDGGLRLNLGYADENVMNYDRPLVLAWRNVGQLSAEEIFDRVSAVAARRQIASVEPAMLTPVEVATQQDGGTWTEIFNEGGLWGWAPAVVLMWLLLVELIFVVTLPLAMTLMRWLPDRGIALAKPFGILLVSWVAWWGTNAGLWRFTARGVFAAVGIVAIVSLAVYLRNGASIRTALRERRRYLVLVEVLFLAAFLAFVLIRAANPDFWHPYRGGEKPMDLSYLTAVVRSSTMPPYDPWYGGGYINYYYYGHFIVSMLIKAMRIVPDVSYNLAVALLFALTFAGAFSVGFNLAEAIRQRRYPHLSPGGALFAGVAVAMLTVVLANVDGMAQLFQGAWRAMNGEPFCAQWAGVCDFWRSSRMMPGQINITEFPFWTFIFADLHAHLIAIPFAVLALGLMVNVLLSARGFRHLAAALAPLALAIGSLMAINTWDVPAYGLLAVAVIGLYLLAHARELRPTTGALWIVSSAVFWMAAYLAFLPFHQRFESPIAGVHASQWRTVLWHYIAIHALFLWIVVTWLLVELYRRFLAPPESPPPHLMERRRITGLLLVAAGALVVALLMLNEGLRDWTTVGMLALLLGVTLVLGSWWLARRRAPDAAPQLFLLVLVAMAFGIGIGVDFVTVDNDIDRMNTVFKLYLNSWVFLSVAGGVGLWLLWAGGFMQWHPDRAVLYLRSVWLGVLALLVISSATFLWVGVKARIADRFNPLPFTLDGTAFMASTVYGDPGPNGRGNAPGSRYPLSHDWEALNYMRRHIEGSPIVLEGATDQYRWTPRVAVYTGLPLVVGWEWHQLQQRGASGNRPEFVRRRVQDARTIYATVDVGIAEELLRRYDVSYVYVGPTERLYFPEDGIAKFQAMVGKSLEVFHENDAVTIYRVTHIN